MINHCVCLLSFFFVSLRENPCRSSRSVSQLIILHSSSVESLGKFWETIIDFIALESLRGITQNPRAGRLDSFQLNWNIHFFTHGGLGCPGFGHRNRLKVGKCISSNRNLSKTRFMLMTAFVDNNSDEPWKSRIESQICILSQLKCSADQARNSASNTHYYITIRTYRVPRQHLLFAELNSGMERVIEHLSSAEIE